MSKVIFLTGATGFLGSNLLQRILTEQSTSRVIVLLRGSSEGEARQRLFETMRLVSAGVGGSLGFHRVEVVLGDITLRRLGLSEAAYRELSLEVTHVIHSAANVQFQLPLDEARQINLDGTKNLMRFARFAASNGQLQRVAYISTAYVSGTRTGKIFESELDRNQQFGNTYERSKFEAESYVRSLLGRLPVTIFRPSIIVGDSRTGRTTTFNVLYTPLKLIYHGLLRVLPGSRRTPLDVVSVDYVSDAILHILLNTGEGIGETFHLSAGGENATTTGEVVDLAVRYFGGASDHVRIPHVAFLPLSLFRSAGRFVHERTRKVLQAMEAYVPYLCFSRTFDVTNTLRALRGTGIASQPFRTYHETILRYCLDVNWGKRLKIAC